MKKAILAITRAVEKRFGIHLLDEVLRKEESEAKFWEELIDNLIKWYNGELLSLYETSTPSNSSKLVLSNERDSAILTWHKAHQEKKYLQDLDVHKDVFNGKKILDVGSGPMPSATCFVGADLYCLEPLLDRYLSIGFKIHYYGNVKFIHACSESIPIESDFFDAVISVNALDHVDNFELTASEIIRVLKPGGILLFHLHYHRATQNEPLELNDSRVGGAFAKVKNFRKIAESRKKMGYKCDDDEMYTLWTNL